jgi:hypothetical protein
MSHICHIHTQSVRAGSLPTSRLLLLTPGVYVYVYTYTYIPERDIYINIYVCIMYTHKCTRIHAYVCVYVSAYIHTYTHILIHTYNPRRDCFLVIDMHAAAMSVVGLFCVCSRSLLKRLLPCDRHACGCNVCSRSLLCLSRSLLCL